MREHQQREWRAAWRDEYLKLICGFANAEGSVLVIDCSDAVEPVSVADAARLRQQPAVTKRELAEQLALRADGIKYHLNNLRTVGVIRHVCLTQSDTGKYSNDRYR
ncbi:AlbA family DNA-binding domain-containing protein [Pseudomonas syringae]|uniref:AlbA family DNA-binding domain-containing protein n=1 Tax=Pseudomonas syringae TaxID=317 RepID=UPI003F797C11